MARNNLRDEEESQRAWPICCVGGELLEHAASPTASHARKPTVAAPLLAAVADQLADELEERTPQSRREVQRAKGGQRNDGDPVRRADCRETGRRPIRSGRSVTATPRSQFASSSLRRAASTISVV